MLERYRWQAIACFARTEEKMITASLKNSTDMSAGSARFSNYDQIMLLHCFQSRAPISKMKDQSIVLIVSLLILSLSVRANKEGAEEEMLRRWDTRNLLHLQYNSFRFFWSIYDYFLYDRLWITVVAATRLVVEWWKSVAFRFEIFLLIHFLPSWYFLTIIAQLVVCSDEW